MSVRLVDEGHGQVSNRDCSVPGRELGYAARVPTLALSRNLAGTYDSAQPEPDCPRRAGGPGRSALMIPRKALPALFAVAALTGCSAGVGNRMAIRPEAVAPRPTVAVADLVANTNRNAEPVQALTAYAAVSDNASRVRGALDGTMVFERPRNFNLKLDGPGGRNYIKVGSNDQEFWFWSKDSEDHAVLVGDYGPGGSVPPGLMFNPDWIVESLGLREIPADEASRIKPEKTGYPNLLVLDHYRDDGRGSTVLKRTVYDLTTRRIRNHIFYAPDRMTKLAVVTPTDYRPVAVNQDEPATAKQVEIPHRLRLELFTAQQEGKKPPILDISLRNVEVNTPFDDDNRQALFSVPEIAGYPPRRITEPQAYAAEGSRSYQSMPAPPAGSETNPDPRADEPAPGFDDGATSIGSGTSLGAPEPIGVDGASLRWSDPLPMGPDLATPDNDPRGTPAIVRPGFPERPAAATASSTDRRGVLGSGFYR